MLMCAALITSCDAFLAAEGRVIDSSGTPVEGASVHLTWGRERGVTHTSDSLGRFALAYGHGVSWPNRGQLAVCKAGYQEWRLDFSEVNRQFQQLEVRLTPDSGSAHACP